MDVYYEKSLKNSQTESHYEIQQLEEEMQADTEVDTHSNSSKIIKSHTDDENSHRLSLSDDRPPQLSNIESTEADSPITSDDSIELNDYEKLYTNDFTPIKKSNTEPDDSEHSNSMLNVHTEYIEGIKVAFPCHPYSVQKTYIAELIKTMKSKKNCLLESPTGTGKTLSLLCATLAYQNHTEGKQKIMYTTRTHQQIRNVIDELKRVKPYYPHLKFSVLGSKKHNCVFDKVAKYRNSRYFDSMCKIKVAKKACGFFNNTMRRQTMDEKIDAVIYQTQSQSIIDDSEKSGGKTLSQLLKEDPATRKKIAAEIRSAPKVLRENDFLKEVGTRYSYLMDEVLDIEELRAEGYQNNFCPYYVEACLKDVANFLVLPYDYIMDPLILDALDFNIEDYVIIFDEAHNVKKKAEEGFSFEVSTKDLKIMKDDLDKLEAKVVKYERAQKSGKIVPFKFRITVETIKWLKSRIDLIKNNFDFQLTQLKNSKPLISKSQSSSSYKKSDSFKSASSQYQSPRSYSNPIPFHQSMQHSSSILSQAYGQTQYSGDSTQFSQNFFSNSQTNPWKSSKSASYDSRFNNSSEKVEKNLDGKVIFNIFDLSANNKSEFNNKETLRSYIEKIKKDKPDYNPMGIIDRLTTYLDSNNYKAELAGLSAIGEAIKFMGNIDMAWQESLLVPDIQRKIKVILECIEKLIFLFQKDILRSTGQRNRDNFSFMDCFKTHLEYSPSEPDNIKVSLWCFHAAPYFKMLEERSPRSFVFTSGTMTPFHFYEFEIGLRCDYKLINKHVIEPKKQLYSCVIGQTNKNTELKFTFENRRNDSMMLELGDSLCNFVQIISYGIVVFFSSYTLLDQCKQLWSKKIANNSSIIERLNRRKRVFFEPKSTQQMTKVMEEYKKEANSKQGAILFGVFRGKASEGMNFSDSMARAVFIVGIPYPPIQDPMIKLKQEYLDSMKDTHDSRIKPISGKDWYELEAIVAVNQAIGRVIRHKNDYGALLFFDVRYKDKRVSTHFPKWMLENFETRLSYSENIKNVSSFLTNHYLDPSLLVSQPKNMNITGIILSQNQESEYARGEHSRSSSLEREAFSAEIDMLDRNSRSIGASSISGEDYNLSQAHHTKTPEPISFKEMSNTRRPQLPERVLKKFKYIDDLRGDEVQEESVDKV